MIIIRIIILLVVIIFTRVMIIMIIMMVVVGMTDMFYEPFLADDFAGALVAGVHSMATNTIGITPHHTTPCLTHHS